MDTAGLERPSPSSTPCPGSPGTSPPPSASGRGTSSPTTGRASTPCATPSSADYAGTPLEPVLLTSLLEAADRVDSTTGVQMAYVKQWAPALVPAARRSGSPSSSARARAVRCGATPARWSAQPARRSSTWPTSTLPTTSTGTTRTTTSGRPSWPGTPPPTTAWPASATTCGTATERLQSPPHHARGPAPGGRGGRGRVVVLSYNNESWLDLRRAGRLCAVRGHVEVLAFDSARYVGARIGIHDPAGQKVGTVGTCATPSTSWWPADAPGSVTWSAVADAGLGFARSAG